MAKLSSSLDTELHPHWGVTKPDPQRRQTEEFREEFNKNNSAELQEKRYIQSK